MRNKKQAIGASKLFISLILVLQGCTSTRLAAGPIVAPVVKTTESYTTVPRYISTEAQSFLLSNGITLDGLIDGNTIMEVQGDVNNIRSLCGTNAISFTTVQMPKDMERILKKYKTNDEYDDYYGYIMANLQRVVLCPDMNFYNNSPIGYTTYGLTILDLSGRDIIYPEENTVYINTLYSYNQHNRDSVIRLYSYVIHETAHILLHKLVADGNLPDYYLLESYSERHSYIRQVNFLKSALQDSELFIDRSFINYYIVWQEKRIVNYNTSLGLPEDDRTLFPR